MAAIKKVTYVDKEDLVVNGTIPDKNKINSVDMNEIKEAVNQRVVVQIDDTPIDGFNLTSTRTDKPTLVKVQLKDTEGNAVYVETSIDKVYFKSKDGANEKNAHEITELMMTILKSGMFTSNMKSQFDILKEYI